MAAPESGCRLALLAVAASLLCAAAIRDSFEASIASIALREFDEYSSKYSDIQVQGTEQKRAPTAKLKEKARKGDYWLSLDSLPNGFIAGRKVSIRGRDYVIDGAYKEGEADRIRLRTDLLTTCPEGTNVTIVDQEVTKKQEVVKKGKAQAKLRSPGTRGGKHLHLESLPESFKKGSRLEVGSGGGLWSKKDQVTIEHVSDSGDATVELDERTRLKKEWPTGTIVTLIGEVPQASGGARAYVVTTGVKTPVAVVKTLSEEIKKQEEYDKRRRERRFHEDKRRRLSSGSFEKVEIPNVPETTGTPKATAKLETGAAKGATILFLKSLPEDFKENSQVKVHHPDVGSERVTIKSVHPKKRVRVPYIALDGETGLQKQYPADSTVTLLGQAFAEFNVVVRRDKHWMVDKNLPTDLPLGLIVEQAEKGGPPGWRIKRIEDNTLVWEHNEHYRAKIERGDLMVPMFQVGDIITMVNGTEELKAMKKVLENKGNDRWDIWFTRRSSKESFVPSAALTPSELHTSAMSTSSDRDLKVQKDFEESMVLSMPVEDDDPPRARRRTMSKARIEQAFPMGCKVVVVEQIVHDGWKSADGKHVIEPYIIENNSEGVIAKVLDNGAFCVQWDTAGYQCHSGSLLYNNIIKKVPDDVDQSMHQERRQSSKTHKSSSSWSSEEQATAKLETEARKGATILFLKSLPEDFKENSQVKVHHPDVGSERVTIKSVHPKKSVRVPYIALDGETGLQNQYPADSTVTLLGQDVLVATRRHSRSLSETSQDSVHSPSLSRSARRSSADVTKALTIDTRVEVIDEIVEEGSQYRDGYRIPVRTQGVVVQVPDGDTRLFTIKWNGVGQKWYTSHDLLGKLKAVPRVDESRRKENSVESMPRRKSSSQMVPHNDKETTQDQTALDRTYIALDTLQPDQPDYTELRGVAFRGSKNPNDTVDMEEHPPVMWGEKVEGIEEDDWLKVKKSKGSGWLYLPVKVDGRKVMFSIQEAAENGWDENLLYLDDTAEYGGEENLLNLHWEDSVPPQQSDHTRSSTPSTGSRDEDLVASNSRHEQPVKPKACPAYVKLSRSDYLLDQVKNAVWTKEGDDLTARPVYKYGTQGNGARFIFFVAHLQAWIIGRDRSGLEASREAANADFKATSGAWCPDEVEEGAWEESDGRGWHSNEAFKIVRYTVPSEGSASQQSPIEQIIAAVPDCSIKLAAEVLKMDTVSDQVNEAVNWLVENPAGSPGRKQLMEKLVSEAGGTKETVPPPKTTGSGTPTTKRREKPTDSTHSPPARKTVVKVTEIAPSTFKVENLQVYKPLSFKALYGPDQQGRPIPVCQVSTIRDGGGLQRFNAEHHAVATLSAGDVITEVNGVADDGEEMVKALYDRDEGKELTIVFMKMDEASKQKKAWMAYHRRVPDPWRRAVPRPQQKDDDRHQLHSATPVVHKVVELDPETAAKEALVGKEMRLVSKNWRLNGRTVKVERLIPEGQKDAGQMVVRVTGHITSGTPKQVTVTASALEPIEAEERSPDQQRPRSSVHRTDLHGDQSPPTDVIQSKLVQSSTRQKMQPKSDVRGSQSRPDSVVPAKQNLFGLIGKIAMIDKHDNEDYEGKNCVVVEKPRRLGARVNVWVLGELHGLDRNITMDPFDLVVDEEGPAMNKEMVIRWPGNPYGINGLRCKLVQFWGTGDHARMWGVQILSDGAKKGEQFRVPAETWANEGRARLRQDEASMHPDVQPKEQLKTDIRRSRSPHDGVAGVVGTKQPPSPAALSQPKLFCDEFQSSHTCQPLDGGFEDWEVLSGRKTDRAGCGALCEQVSSEFTPVCCFTNGNGCYYKKRSKSQRGHDEIPPNHAAAKCTVRTEAKKVDSRGDRDRQGTSPGRGASTPRTAGRSTATTAVGRTTASKACPPKIILKGSRYNNWADGDWIITDMVSSTLPVYTRNKYLMKVHLFYVSDDLHAWVVAKEVGSRADPGHADFRSERTDPQCPDEVKQGWQESDGREWKFIPQITIVNPKPEVRPLQPSPNTEPHPLHQVRQQYSTQPKEPIPRTPRHQLLQDDRQHATALTNNHRLVPSNPSMAAVPTTGQQAGPRNVDLTGAKIASWANGGWKHNGTSPTSGLPIYVRMKFARPVYLFYESIHNKVWIIGRNFGSHSVHHNDADIMSDYTLPMLPDKVAGTWKESNGEAWVDNPRLKVRESGQRSQDDQARGEALRKNQAQGGAVERNDQHMTEAQKINQIIQLGEQFRLDPISEDEARKLLGKNGQNVERVGDYLLGLMGNKLKGLPGATPP